MKDNNPIETTGEKSFFAKNAIYLLLLIGIFFRLFIFFTSPPNNAHDNHMEVVGLYAENFERPGLFDCFQCYQPPTYYYLGAVVYRTSKFLGFSNFNSWKMVQFVNTFLSILILLFFYKILLELGISNKLKILYLSFLVVLPRDILASAMIANDYLVVFAAVAALFYYLRCLRYLAQGANNASLPNYIKLAFFVLLGTLSKQHGLILLFLPGSMMLLYLFKERRFALTRLLPILTIIIALAFGEELWKYSKSGKFLVSNYDHYANAHNQFPGSLDKVEFFNFKLAKLFKEPFMTQNTSASVPTEIFARTFFDYEWRFSSPRTVPPIWMGRLAYSLGLIWLAFFLVTMFLWVKAKIKEGEGFNLVFLGYLVPIVLGLFYLMVPVLQTMRYPHFSCMKAIFVLPGWLCLLAVHSLVFNKVKSQFINNYYLVFVGLNIIFGLLFLFMIYTVLDTEISLDNLRGPLWKYPG